MECLCFTTLGLLWILSVFRPAVLLECSPTQYEWPAKNPQFCCNKCPPGQEMISRDRQVCGIKCEFCIGDRFTNRYNVGDCKVCRNCNKTGMELVSPCTSTRDAVCRCKEGFTCADEEDCSLCVQSPLTTQTASTTASTRKVLPTLKATTTTTTTTTTTKPVQDTVWFLVIIGLLCLGIALVIVTKLRPVLNWATRNTGWCLVKKPASARISVPTEEDEEDEEPCTPVQESKGDPLIEV